LLPLFSLAQFVNEVDELPSKIGKAHEPDSLPFLPTDDGYMIRNCDDVELIQR